MTRIMSAAFIASCVAVECVMSVVCPAGRNGDTIREMCRVSRCKINVPRSERRDPRGTQVILLKGVATAVKHAKVRGRAGLGVRGGVGGRRGGKKRGWGGTNGEKVLGLEEEGGGDWLERKRRRVGAGR